MPNHVHVLVKPETRSLHHIVKSWKSFTAREINMSIGAQGALWFREYHDRYIRDDDHYQNAKAYIRMNPVKAGLCKEPRDWEFSSAWKER